jgi:hypothetical protein
VPPCIHRGPEEKANKNSARVRRERSSVTGEADLFIEVIVVSLQFPSLQAVLLRVFN